MALFAKMIEYCGSGTSYCAVIAVAKKKGGTPISHIVYANLEFGNRFLMHTFFSCEEAKRHVTSNLGNEHMETSGWLHNAAKCDRWVRVPVPRIGGRKRRRKPMKVGDLGALYRLAKLEMESVRSDLAKINSEIFGHQNRPPERLKIAREIAEEYLIAKRVRVSNVHHEMRFARSRRTGVPLPASFYKGMSLYVS